MSGPGVGALPESATVRADRDRDLARAIVCWIVQCALPLIGIAFANWSMIDDSYCSLVPGDGYADCGDPALVDRAVLLSRWSGLVLLSASAICIVVQRLRRRRTAFIAATFLVVEAVAVGAAVVMAAQFGPG